jgi:hypothetical protein
VGENGIEKEWNVIFIARLLTYNTHARVGQSKASRMEFQTIFFFFFPPSSSSSSFLFMTSSTPGIPGERVGARVIIQNGQELLVVERGG